MRDDKHQIPLDPTPHQDCGEPQLLRKRRVQVPWEKVQISVQSWLGYNNPATGRNAMAQV